MLTGLASELSLRPLGAALERRGYAVRVVDLADEAVSSSVVPDGEGPIVLVTSQHLAMTSEAYRAYVGFDSYYESPQELRRRLDADLVVYVPHDLKDPVLPTEVALLQTIDLYAAADDDEWWAAAHVPTVVVGWVGTAHLHPIAEPPHLENGVLFLTFVQWLMAQGGGPYVARTLANTLDLGLAVKLPVWPGLDSIVDTLTDRGVNVLDPSLSATLIAHHTPLVVTNGPSSVLAEAAIAGHRPLCVLSTDGAAEFRGMLDDLDVAVCSDEEVATARGTAGRIRPPQRPFDLDRFLTAVTDALGARGA